MKLILVVVIASASIVMTGCTAFNKRYSDYAIKDLNIDQDSAYMKLLMQLQTTPEIDNPYLPKYCFQIPIDKNRADECQQKRNATLATLIVSSEQLCVDHRKTIYGNDAAWNITTGTFTNLFAGAATIATGASPKTLYSALALLSNSERALVNETVYKSVIVPVVDKKIMQSRDTRARAFYDSFGKPIDSYSVNLALRDVVAFHYSCSFMDGLRLALEEGVQESPRQKAARLSAVLALLNTEMAGISDREGSQKAQYVALVLRHTSLSAEIMALEKQ